MKTTKRGNNLLEMFNEIVSYVGVKPTYIFLEFSQRKLT